MGSTTSKSDSINTGAQGTQIGDITTPQPAAETTMNTTGTSIGEIKTPQPKAATTIVINTTGTGIGEIKTP